MVIPLKALPYLLLIAGVYGVGSGEEVGFGIGCLVVGAVWLAVKYLGKNKQ